MSILRRLSCVLALTLLASCIPCSLEADGLPVVVTTNFTPVVAASSNALRYRGSVYWYKGGLSGIAGSRVYSDDSSRNVTYNPQEPSGKTWMVSGTWQWATNGLDVSRVVFNDNRPADFYKAEVVSGHVLIDDESLLEGNPAFSNAVVAVAGTSLSGITYDFGTQDGLYAAVRDMVQALGGSVTNFPSGGGGSWTINTNGTVTTEGELNPDGTVTIEGTLNPDGTVTVEAQ